MLRFNQEYGVYYRFQFKFQYILCYGSTEIKLDKEDNIKKFQYILCYGSTGRRFLGFIQRQDFNTSYVTVQLTLPLSVSVAVPDFNTSYVTVQQYLYVFKIQGFFDFNTSYVTVQHYNHIFLKNH